MSVHYGTPIVNPKSKPLWGKESRPYQKGSVGKDNYELLYRSSAIDSLHFEENEWSPQTFVSTRQNRYKEFQHNRDSAGSRSDYVADDSGGKNGLFQYMDQQDRRDYEQRIRLIPITSTRKGEALVSLFDKQLLLMTEDDVCHKEIGGVKPWSFLGQLMSIKSLKQASEIGCNDFIQTYFPPAHGDLRDVNDKKGVDFGQIVSDSKSASTSTPTFGPRAQKTKKRRITLKAAVPSSGDDYYEDEYANSGPSLNIKAKKAINKAPANATPTFKKRSIIKGPDESGVPTFVRPNSRNIGKEPDTVEKDLICGGFELNNNLRNSYRPEFRTDPEVYIPESSSKLSKSTKDNIDSNLPSYQINIKQEPQEDWLNAGDGKSSETIPRRMKWDVKVKSQEPPVSVADAFLADISTTLRSKIQSGATITETRNFPIIPRIPLFNAQRALSLSSTLSPISKDGRYLAFLKYNVGLLPNYYESQDVIDAVIRMTEPEMEQELREFVDRAAHESQASAVSEETDLKSTLRSYVNKADGNSQLERVVPQKPIVFTSSSHIHDIKSDQDDIKDRIKQELEDKFISSHSNDMNPTHPQELRKVEDWSPSPLLCKRFGVKIPMVSKNSEEIRPADGSKTLQLDSEKRRGFKSKGHRNGDQDTGKKTLFSSRGLSQSERNQGAGSSKLIDMYYNASLCIPRAQAWMYEALFGYKKKR